MKKCVIVSAAALLASFPAAGLPQDKPAAPSLYERLGGVYPISAVVDDFIERVYVSATLNANPAVSRARSPLHVCPLARRCNAAVACQPPDRKLSV